jgi:hypothetical protein
MSDQNPSLRLDPIKMGLSPEKAFFVNIVSGVAGTNSPSVVGTKGNRLTYKVTLSSS